MKRNIFLVCAGLVLFLCGSLCFAAAPEEEALEAAKSWLTLVDQGKYEKSWQEASSLMQRSATVEQWKKAVTDARQTLGNVITREFSSSKLHTSLPGAPDGQYVVIIFKSSFEKKKEGVETVTPMLDQDGKWRVSGYYVK